MSDIENPAPQVLAKDIQQNVEAALQDPTNMEAKERLHQFAQHLDGQLSVGDNGRSVNHNEPYQEAVQRELDKLEADGTLPKITITQAGQIDASMKLPGDHTEEYQSRRFITPNVRSLVADPITGTEVRDFV